MMDTRFHALVLRVLGFFLVFHGSTYAANAIDAVVVDREDIYVVGRDEVEARYCTQLSLKNIDTGRGYPRQLSWLRLENIHTLLQGDAVGPLGTRMVISVKNAGSNDTSHAPSSRAELLLSMDFPRTEVLLKEVLGGEAIGWAFSGPLEVDARVIRSPFKTMVLFQDEVGLGSELSSFVPKSFEVFFVPETSLKGGELVPSTLGLWHWLPGTGLQKQDRWPSFFTLLGTSLSTSPKVEKKSSFLSNWLATRSPLWAQELTTSQWQVHQRSLTLAPPQGKRKGLSLTYCESAVASSPPNCTLETEAGRELSHNSQLRVKLESKDLATCTTSRPGVEALWVLQDLKRKLIGNGAHRTLTSVVTLSASSAAVQRVSKTCQLRLVERLPTGVFADQFELQGIQRRGGFEKAWIHGDVNLEQPAFLSTQSIVDVCVTLHKVASDGNNGSASSLQAEVALPLHARYPPLSVDSHSVVHIPMPYMLVSCQDVEEEGIAVPGTDKWKQVFLGKVTELETFPRVLDWMVPAGNPADYSFVARFTAIAALCGVLVVFAASVAADEQRR